LTRSYRNHFLILFLVWIPNFALSLYKKLTIFREFMKFSGYNCFVYFISQQQFCRSQWPRDLRCVPTADRLLGLRVRITPGSWMVVRCECCVLSGRGLCDGLITRPEESYRLWCVLVCDLGTSRMRRLKLIKDCKCRLQEEEQL
jgi:hypothetical protein